MRIGRAIIRGDGDGAANDSKREGATSLHTLDEVELTSPCEPSTMFAVLGGFRRRSLGHRQGRRGPHLA
jgi:hypothetical protein